MLVPTFARRHSLARSRIIAAVVAVTVPISFVALSHVFLFLPKHNKSDRTAIDVNDPNVLLAEADHFYWLNNGTQAAPLYAKAEHLYAFRGDLRGELHARVGLRRSEAETAAFIDLSRFLDEQLRSPIVTGDPQLRLWCLVAKGYTDIEINYREAKLDWTQAKRLAQDLGLKQWVTRASGELGLIAFMQGDVRKAAKLLGGALLTTMVTGDTGGEIRFLSLLGGGFEEINRHSEALKFFERAIKLARGNKECGFPFMAVEGEAEALAGLGRQDDAEKVLQEALAQARVDEKLGHQAHILMLLGKLAARTGKPTLAIKYMEEAGQYGRRMKFDGILADSMLDLAKLYRDLGDLRNAESRAVQGLAASQRIGDLYFVPRDLTVLADLKARQGHVAEANALYSHAEDIITAMLMTVDGPIWNSSTAGSMSQTYLQHFELVRGNGNISAAFRVLEQVRGRTLAWEMRDTRALSTSESTQTVDLEQEISTLQKQLMRSGSSSGREQVLEHLVETEHRLELAGTARQSTGFQLVLKPSALSRVQEDLKADEVILEYVLDDPSAFCLSISRRVATIQKLPAGRATIEMLSKRFIEGVRAKGNGAEISRNLYDVLIRPIQAATRARELVIVPDGLLNLLPFEALRDELGDYLLKTHMVSYAPSGTVLDLLRHSDSGHVPRPFLGVGDVEYENQGGKGANIAAPTTSGTRIVRGIASLTGIGLHDLPQTREEVLNISQMMGPQSKYLLGKAATETAFKREPLDQFRILHLAVHGFVDTDLPERSALVLGIDSQSNDDGLLQIREIVKLRFNADLITLSACDSGVGKLQGQEGVSNLVEAFLAAGSKSVVASLWAADDTFTRALMQEFYRGLSHGETVGYALRDAKLALLARYGYEVNPYFWAAFVAIGDTSRRINL